MNTVILKIEKWICIQTSSHSKKYLTPGKIYDVITDSFLLEETEWKTSYFVGDDGVEYLHSRNIHGSELIPLEEWRQKQLDKLEV